MYSSQLARLYMGVTSRALRLDNQLGYEGQKTLNSGSKMIALLFFNKLGASSTGYAHSQPSEN